MRFQQFRPTLEMLRLVGEIDEFKGAWRLLSNMSPERLSALKHLSTIESIGSSTRIEGASLSDQQVDNLLSGLKTKSFRSRDEQEVAGYAEVMDAVLENWQHIPLTENFIKQLHRDLLKHSTKDSRHRGAYKTTSNNVEAFGANGERLGIVFQTATPFDVPYKMTDLITWTNEHLDAFTLHPLLIIAAFVVTFLAIHPFQDGNGRLSRVLTTLLLLKNGYSYVPYSSLESIIESNKEGYYLALRRTQSSLDSKNVQWDSWIEFFLQSLQKQKASLQAKISREHLLEGALPQLSVRILELVREIGRLKTSYIEQVTGESRSTIKLRLNELIKNGNLRRHGRGPATWYVLRRED
jgi:Fic family protein